jgi:16S rRNA (guanine(966)-N(2))-methyltransferase RsmD
MRITTGKYKGRNLLMPKGIRPTQDKVRKAIFDILGDIEGLSFLELYAGSGAVGLEALSRGAADVVMVELNRDCQVAIRKNMETLKAVSCSLYPQEAEKAILRLHKDKRSFDIIFLDPPYYMGKVGTPGLIGKAGVLPSAATPNLKGKVGVSVSLTKNTLQTLGAYDILAPNGLVIAQHFKRDDLPKEAGNLALIKESRYGDTILSIYRKA